MIFQVFLINAADPLSGMTLVWESEGLCHCIVEHHQAYLFLFTDATKDGKPVENHYLLRCPVNPFYGPATWEVSGKLCFLTNVSSGLLSRPSSFPRYMQL